MSKASTEQAAIAIMFLASLTLCVPPDMLAGNNSLSGHRSPAQTPKVTASHPTINSLIAKMLSNWPMGTMLRWSRRTGN